MLEISEVGGKMIPKPKRISIKFQLIDFLEGHKNKVEKWILF